MGTLLFVLTRAALLGVLAVIACAMRTDVRSEDMF